MRRSCCRAAAVGRGKTGGMRDVEVRYAEHGGKCLAYEVFGEGPTDLLVHQVCYPIDLTWDLPQLSEFMGGLGECARVIAFDSRGEGASDPIDDPGAATLEAWCDDALAVLDAAGADRATVFDMTTGVGGIVLAATYPDRVRSLILSHLWTSNPELRTMSPSELRQISRTFSSVEDLEVMNPRVAHDPVLRQWWGRAHRLLLSPEAAFDYYQWGARMDVEPLLSSVRVPTLVLHRRNNRVFDIEISRLAAAKIRDARFVELPGSETDLFLGDTRPVLAAVRPFLEAESSSAVDDVRQLATVLFTDIVASTEHLAAMGDARGVACSTSMMVLWTALSPHTGDASSTGRATGSWPPSTVQHERYAAQANP